VVLVWLKEPLLVGGEWGAILLVRASVKGTREEVAVEATAGFKEGVRPLDTVPDERSEFFTSFAVRDGEEMPRRVGELFETSLEVPFPARTRVDARLRRPVFFVVVETLGPVGR
jgi:hypothetical protein